MSPPRAQCQWAPDGGCNVAIFRHAPDAPVESLLLVYTQPGGEEQKMIRLIYYRRVVCYARFEGEISHCYSIVCTSELLMNSLHPYCSNDMARQRWPAEPAGHKSAPACEPHACNTYLVSRPSASTGPHVRIRPVLMLHLSEQRYGS